MKRVITHLIFNLISERFLKSEEVYDELEDLGNKISSIFISFLNIILLVKKSSLNLNKNIKKQFFQLMFIKFEYILKFKNKIKFYHILKYLKFREIREYIGRKHKSKFIKPKRNDEKILKIFKNLMKNLFLEYKSKYLYKEKINLIFKVNQIKNNMFNKNLFNNFGKINKKQNENDFFFNKNICIKRNKLKKENFQNNFQICKKKKNINLTFKNNKSKLISQDIKYLFYDFYFGETSLNNNIPLNYFFDPLKPSLENKKFKSFKLAYFRLLLSSKKFKNKLENILNEELFYFDLIKEYPILLNNIYYSTPTFILDQFKSKSKFLWTS